MSFFFLTNFNILIIVYVIYLLYVCRRNFRLKNFVLKFFAENKKLNIIKMLDKYFVPYDRALKLYELRFNEPCFRFWQYKNGNIKHITTEEGSYYNRLHEPTSEFFWISSPLFCQAFDWFREKYDLSGETQSHQFYFMYNIIFDTLGNNTCKAVSYGYESYEEAQLACLDKLIEICS